jgi:LPXTG-motif cell wall-anchored protein
VFFYGIKGGKKMKNRGFSRKAAVILTIAMLFILQAVPVLSYHASAAALSNGAMISVLDKDGKTVMPLTAVELNKKDETAYDVLKEVTSQKKVKLDATYYEKYQGFLVNQIGNATPEGQDYWSFYINGSESEVGLSGYKVQKGDDLLMKIVSYPAKVTSATVSAKDDKGNAVIPETKVSLVDGSNAYDALKQAAAMNKKIVDAPIDSKFFAYVQNLGNTKLDKNEYWNMFMNGKSMDAGLSSYIIRNGDHLEVKLTNPSAPAGTGTGSSNGSSGNGTAKGNGAAPASGFSKDQVAPLVRSAVKYMVKHGVNDEFAIMGLKKAGENIPASYLQEAAKSLKGNNGTFRNVTDYERMALGITAAGKNAANFSGYNLIKNIYSNDRMTNQGTNGIIFALLSIDSGKYKLPANAKWSRGKLVQYLVSHQLKDGSWALYGNTSSVDITAMTLSALAPYKSQGPVKNAIDKAVHWLSMKQDKQGGYSSSDNGGDSSETTAQVIIGLTSVNVSPGSKEFTKQGGNLLKHLVTFKQKDGGYAHIVTNHASDQISTTQALLGLTAYQSYLSGKGSVYQFSVPAVIQTKEATDPQKSVSTKAKSTATAVLKTTGANITSSKQGGELPNTATNNENWLIAGIILVSAGAAVYIILRKRESLK